MLSQIKSYITIAVLAATLIGGFGVGYQLGAGKANREILRLQREHIAAMEEQKERSALVVKELEDKRIELVNLRMKLDEEASNDPDATKPAVSKRSVQRLNQIR